MGLFLTAKPSVPRLYMHYNAQRSQYHRYNEQMKLQDSELFRFRNEFERFGLETDNEKRAAILCQRGKSEMFVRSTTWFPD